MKLTLINPRFLPLVGGGETYTLELMSNFSDRGWEVHLITSQRSHKGEYWNSCKIHYIEEFDNYYLNPNVCLPRLHELLSEISPDVVHIHNYVPFFIYSSITKPNEFPSVLTIHNSPIVGKRLLGTFSNYQAEVAFVRELLSNNKFNRLVVGSEHYASSLIEVAPWLKEGKLLELVPYFVPRNFKGFPALDFGPTTNPINVLFPSRITYEKGVVESLVSLASLPQNYRLTIPAFNANDTRAYKSELQAIIDKLGLERRISYPETAPRPEQMPSYYRNAHMVLVPSHNEGFGFVGVEALQCKRPVVFTDIGGLKEIFTHEVNGMRVPVKSSSSIASAILQLTNDAPLREKLVENGARLLDKKYSRSKHMNRIEEIYLELAKSRSS